MKNRIKNIARTKKSWIVLSAAIVLILSGIFILIGTQQPGKDNSIVMIGGADGPTYIGAYSNMVDITGISIYKNSKPSQKTLACGFDQEDKDVLDEFWGIYGLSESFNNDAQATHPMTAKVEYNFNGAQAIMWLNYGSQEFITVTLGKNDQYFNIKNKALEDYFNELVADSGSSIPPDEQSVSIELSDSSYEPMNDYIDRLSSVLSEEPVADMLPVDEIPADKLAWFLKHNNNVTIEACKGISFDNGDFLLVFFYETEEPDETVLEIVAVRMSVYVNEIVPSPQYSANSAVDHGFGFVAYSENDMDNIIADIAFKAKER